MTHEMKLHPQYLQAIKSGQKVYEIRLNDEKRQRLSVSDTIIFKSTSKANQTAEVTVTELKYFKTFTEMLNDLAPSKIGFHNQSKEAIKKVYHAIYSPDQEAKYGVVAIGIKCKADLK